MLCEEIEAATHKIRKPVKLFEFLPHNNKCNSFLNLFIAVRVYMTVTVPPDKGVFISSN